MGGKIFVILFLVVIVVVLVFFLVAIITGVVKGMQRVGKINNLQKNADVSITSKNGEFVFKYATKLYMSERKVIIIIVPELPLSSWKANCTYANQGVSAFVKIRAKDFNSEIIKEFKLKDLEQRLEIDLEDNMVDQILEITIDSKWIFADEDIDENVCIILGE